MKDRLLIIQDDIPHFRIGLFNTLAEKYDLVILHSNPKITDGNNFQTIYLKRIKLGPFYLQTGLINAIHKLKPKRIIAMMDIRYLSTIYLSFHQESINILIWWGPWLTDSRIANYIRLYLMKRHISLLYSPKHKDDFVLKGLSESKLIVANNSIYVENRIKSFKFEKRYFLFVGSFKRRKGINELLDAYEAFLNESKSKINLILVGDGEIYKEIDEKISKNRRLRKNVYLPGRIEGDKELSEYFKNAIACFSINQAGLSVLQSLAFGVPYITLKNAISGGEINNILDGNTGFLCNNLSEIKDRMKFLHSNPKIAVVMGENSYDYYTKKASIELMVESFNKAINN